MSGRLEACNHGSFGICAACVAEEERREVDFTGDYLPPEPLAPSTVGRKA